MTRIIGDKNIMIALDIICCCYEISFITNSHELIFTVNTRHTSEIHVNDDLRY